MKRLYELICQAEVLAAKWALAALSLLVLAAAIARTIHYPIIWAVDAATFLFAWVVFFGADIAMRRDRLFCIDLVTSKLPPKAQRFLKVLNHLIIAAFLLGMIGYGSWLSYTTRLRRFQGMPGVSYTWVTISVPIGCLLMLITAVRKIRMFLRGGPTATGEHQTTEVI